MSTTNPMQIDEGVSSTQPLSRAASTPTDLEFGRGSDRVQRWRPRPAVRLAANTGCVGADVRDVSRSPRRARSRQQLAVEWGERS
jgi:hypothetical protein